MIGTQDCGCTRPSHSTRLVVLTGGPGAGKTAVLELVRRTICQHVAVLPEAASIIFGGGFPRRDTLPARRAAQRAIVRVQQELERWVTQEEPVAMGLCDRGTLDGLAYWPGSAEDFFSELGTTREKELARYAAVIHLRTPPADAGYNHHNPLRIESPEEAAAIDARIEQVWSAHPRRFVIPNTQDFMEKARHALMHIRAELPECCLGRFRSSTDGLPSF
ncbi:ATP/GTP-binding protein [Hyalangium gracile]|uniref:ATP/GTP-binding protein n=1 Tax=Hyalangium gracile TaxID=394092 RepID=UPI001CCFF0EB|nr:ATP-binding protein [Hyalangium gracile]